VDGWGWARALLGGGTRPPPGLGQPAGWPAAAMAITFPPWFARRPLEQAARHGRVRGGRVIVGGRVGQADLAARGQGPAGLAGLLGQQPAALGRLEEPLVDLAVVEGACGDQVVEVAGSTPTAAGCAGPPERSRPERAPRPMPPGRNGHPGGHWRPGAGPGLVAAGVGGAGAARAAPRAPGRVGYRDPGRRATGRGGRRRGGWVGRPHSRPGPANPHTPVRPGWRCRGRSG
jgi:hypothetical protein